MTDYTGTPSNAQARINALLPGDTLTLQTGTYPRLTVGVSGTPTAPILIRGTTVNDLGQPTTIINATGTDLTVTGNYLHIVLMGTQGGSRGFDVTGASHVMLEKCRATDSSGEGFCVRNNSRFIHLVECQASGVFNSPGTGCTPGFRLGTPSGSWANTSTPDATSFVQLRFCKAWYNDGEGFRLYEGAHHLVLEDCDHDVGTISATPLGYNSQASYVQFKRSFCLVGAATYGWRCFETTVGGVRYGGNQELYMCAARLDSASTQGAVASQALDLRVYGFRANTSFGGQLYVEVNGVPWTTFGDLPREAFTEPITWASPAYGYALYPEGPGEFGLFKHFWGAHSRSIDPAVQTQATGQTAGTEFWIDEGIERAVHVVKIGYWQAHPSIGATKCAIYDAETREMVPGSLVNITSTSTWGWRHAALTQTVILVPGRRYWAAVYSPANTVPAELGGQSGIVMGLFPPQYWDGGFGMDGVHNGIIHAPNRFEATANDTSTLSSPGPDILVPDSPINSGYVFSDNNMIDVIVGYYRPPGPITANPGDDLQAILDSLIPGDVLTISGVHVGDFWVRQSGTENRNITIKGDGTAILRTPWGTDGVQTGLRVTSSYVHIRDLIVEQAGRAILVEQCGNVKLRNITARFTRGAGIVVRGAKYIYHDSCIAHDTGTDLNTGDGFRCGTTPGDWPGGDTGPDATQFVRYDNCQAYRTLGDGFDVNAAASDVVLSGCQVDHTRGNAPLITPTNEPVSGTSGFHSRGDRVQFISCQVLGAPGSGYKCFDVLWANVTYGRNQEVKNGFSTGHTIAGVASQSEGMKVYSDFTATPTPRVKEIAGGWAATGSNVNPTSFAPRQWTSPAATY